MRAPPTIAAGASHQLCRRHVLCAAGTYPLCTCAPSRADPAPLLLLPNAHGHAIVPLTVRPAASFFSWSSKSGMAFLLERRSVTFWTTSLPVLMYTCLSRRRVREPGQRIEKESGGRAGGWAVGQAGGRAGGRVGRRAGQREAEGRRTKLSSCEQCSPQAHRQRPHAAKKTTDPSSVLIWGGSRWPRAVATRASTRSAVMVKADILDQDPMSVASLSVAQSLPEALCNLAPRPRR